MTWVGERKKAVSAAAACLLIAALVGVPAYSIRQSQDAYHQQAQNNAEAAARNATTRVQRQCAGLQGRVFAQCEFEVVDAASERQNNEYNLETQRKLANGGNWLIIIGAIEIFLTGVGLWIIYGQLHATRIGFQTENRAWVEIDPTFKLRGVRFTEDGQFFLDTSDFAARNIGKTVALNVGWHISVIPDPLVFPQHNGVEEFKRQLLTHSPADTWPIFPARSVPFGDWDVGGIANDMLIPSRGENEAFLPAVCVGVRYNTIFDRECDPPHITMEVSMLRRIVGGHANGAFVGRVSVPSAQIALVRHLTNLTEIT